MWAVPQPHSHTYTLKLFSEHLSTLLSPVSQVLNVDSESQDEECKGLPVKQYKPSSQLSEKDPNTSHIYIYNVTGSHCCKAETKTTL